MGLPEIDTVIQVGADVLANAPIRSRQDFDLRKKAFPGFGSAKFIVTPKRTKKNARAALVAGSPRGVFSTEDRTATSGRGTLLGN